jgi:hypothetical protein
MSPTLVSNYNITISLSLLTSVLLAFFNFSIKKCFVLNEIDLKALKSELYNLVLPLLVID